MNDEVEIPKDEANQKFLVLEIHFEEGGVTKAYILKPGDVFARFGGSRSGLLVRKTPSLIVSHIHHGCTDVEYDVHDLKVWRQLIEKTRMPGTRVVLA